MKWAEGHYDSMYGRIYSKWELTNGSLLYQATVPANTTATLYLPAESVEGITENNVPVVDAEGITSLGFENGRAVYQLQPGSYSFRSEL